MTASPATNGPADGAVFWMLMNGPVEIDALELHWFTPLTTGQRLS
ncbi:hypothetical protein [Diaphorobacter sp. HDW4B]|nr:hypothetical protein [Diaphorobacter sp. HDW4B]